MTIIQSIDPEHATLLKERGNECFKNKEYERAIQFYFEALPYCSTTTSTLCDDDGDELVGISDDKESTSDDRKDENDGDDASNEKSNDDKNNNEKNNDENNIVVEAEEEIEDPNDKQCRELECMLRSNLAACFVSTGAYNRAISQSNRALKLVPNYNKALFRRMQANEALDKLDDALSDAKLLKQLHPESALAQTEADRLEKMVQERRKREMDQMLGQLKELGNTLLGKIGLSLDQFNVQRDDKNGTFSINMQQQQQQQQ